MARFGPEAMAEVAIEEWMGASPIYTRRMQRALRIEGDDVPTIFKGIQFDIGAPHQFMVLNAMTIVGYRDQTGLA